MPEKEEDKIILHVDMDCEGCKAKVRKALKEFKGVEGLDVSMQDQKVTIRGKLDAKQVYETVKKKSGKRTVLIYPDLSKIAQQDSKPAQESKKEPPPPDPEIVVVLKVNMHCAACAKQIRKSLLKMDGVDDVTEDFPNSIVTVKGKRIDPNKLCTRVKKRSGKHCEIVPPPAPSPPPPAPKEEAKPAEEKKEEEKKAEEAKPAEETKKEEEKPVEAETKVEEKEGKKENVTKKEEKSEEKKEEKIEEKKEEKAEEKKEEKKEEGVDVKKYEYIPYRTSVSQYYIYPPQIFSDENPNACSIM